MKRGFHLTLESDSGPEYVLKKHALRNQIRLHNNRSDVSTFRWENRSVSGTFPSAPDPFLVAEALILHQILESFHHFCAGMNREIVINMLGRRVRMNQPVASPITEDELWGLVHRLTLQVQNVSGQNGPGKIRATGARILSSSHSGARQVFIHPVVNAHSAVEMFYQFYVQDKDVHIGGAEEEEDALCVVPDK